MRNPQKILTQREYDVVLAALKRKFSHNARQNEIIFRLSAYCGLRAKEIVGVTLADFQLDSERPYLRIRSEITKRCRDNCGRIINLNWDGDTLAALREWKQQRIWAGASENSPFVCNCYGKALLIRSVQYRWHRMLQPLGRERAAYVNLHSGRASYASHHHKQGKTLVQVATALGHANPATTAAYLANVDADDATVGNMFAA